MITHTIKNLPLIYNDVIIVCLMPSVPALRLQVLQVGQQVLQVIEGGNLKNYINMLTE